MKKVMVASIIVLFVMSNTSTLNALGIGIQTYGSESIILNRVINQVEKWTWMFYSDADFLLAYRPLNEFAEEAYSGENLDVIVLQDIFFPPGFSGIYRIDENHNAVLKKNWGEVNMGDYTTLRDFINYCKINYPADRYFLSVYNHGGAWMGACTDYTSLGDILTMDEFQKALDEAGGVDILCFTGACNMGSAESVYELRNLIDVYIGSEEGNGYYSGWDGSIDDICDILNSPIYHSNIEIGAQIIQLVENNEEHPEDKESTTVSAIRTDKIDELADAISNLRTILSVNIEDYFEDIRDSHQNSKLFLNHLLDIYNFCENYGEIQGLDETLENALDDVMYALNDCVIAEWHGNQQSGAHGLTIEFPLSWLNFNDIYSLPSYGLDFPSDTHWDAFLYDFYTEAIHHIDQIDMQSNSTLQNQPSSQPSEQLGSTTMESTTGSTTTNR